jgi:hypothetical protein
MSRFIRFFLVGLLISVSSCGQNENQQTSSNPPGVNLTDYSEFQMITLDQHELQAQIFIPDASANIGASTKPEIEHNDSFIWKITAGPKFELYIEDFGDYKDRMVNKKKELQEQHDFFQIKYLIDEPQLLLYERKLIVKGDKNASPKVGVDHITYHVYGEKIIDGITYELRSKDEGLSADQKHIAEMLAKTIKSFNKLSQ